MDIISPLDKLSNLKPPKEIDLKFLSPLDDFAYKYEVHTKFWERGEPAQPGYIYAFDSPHGVKIGLSKNPHKRFQSIKASLPFEIGILVIIPVADMPTREIALHNHFAENRIRGEWFKLNKQ